MFVIPEDIKALDEAALSAALESARAEYAEFADIPDEELSDDQIDRIEALAGFHEAATAEQAERAEAASSRAERLANARQALAVEEEPEAPVDEEPEKPAEKVEEPAEKVEEPVAASTKRTVTARAARNAPQEPPARTRATIVASADIGGGFATGQRLESMAEVADAVSQRLKGMQGLGGGEKRRNRYGVARFQKQHKGTILSQANREFRSDDELLAAASKESRLSGGSLTAAGGWGAPSETLYDLCDPGASTEGILDIPEVTVNRGGMRYTKGLSFGDVLTTALAGGDGFFSQTEAEAEAATPKTVMRPPTPEFTEDRLDAVGVMIEAGLLLRQGYPEVIQQFTEYALIANQHRVARRVLTDIQTLIGAPVEVAGAGNALDVLHVLELAAIGERERNRMGFSATLEVLLPHWVKAVIRADLANRNGVDMLSVSDAQIEGFFSQRGLRTQFIYNHQELDVTAGIATAYPESIEAVMYPAGTYIKGTSDVITLDTVYDSTNLTANDYIHLFAEEGVLVANPCGDGRRITVPLNINGRTSAADLAADYLSTTPAP